MQQYYQYKNIIYDSKTLTVMVVLHNEYFYFKYFIKRFWDYIYTNNYKRCWLRMPDPSDPFWIALMVPPGPAYLVVVVVVLVVVVLISIV